MLLVAFQLTSFKYTSETQNTSIEYFPSYSGRLPLPQYILIFLNYGPETTTNVNFNGKKFCAGSSKTEDLRRNFVIEIGSCLAENRNKWYKTEKM